MDPVKLFISYSHDSDEHRERVLALSERLRQDGYVTLLDQYVNGTPAKGWPRWMLDQLDEADFVLVVCTETYYRRFRGHEEPGRGKGVDWEGALISQEIYDSRSDTRKFVPTLFDAADEKSIPEPIRGPTRYVLRSEAEYQALCDFLGGAAGVEPGPVRARAPRTRRQATPLAFDEPEGTAAATPAPFTPRWTDELKTYGDGWAGREAELAALDEAWRSGATRVLSLHAEGGAGKTRVLVKWLNNLRDDGWRGAGGVFVHSFYSQGSDERRNASSEVFFDQALDYFGYQGAAITDPNEKGRRLAELIAARHGLLVLDGLEPLQHPPAFNDGRLKDPAIERLLMSLSLATAGAPAPALCIVTSRQPVVELRPREGRAVVQRHLERLDTAAGVELLRQLEVRGPERELLEAVDEFRGHAYSLMLLGTYLRDATEDHEVRRRHEIPLLEEDEGHRSHADRMFRAYVRHLGEDRPEVAVLRLLGFFDRAAERELLDVLRTPQGVVYEQSPSPQAKPKPLDDRMPDLTAALRGLSNADWHRVLRRLHGLRLIAAEPGQSAIDSHPLLREHFAERAREDFPEAWAAGHRRLYEHLCGTTPHRPDTLEGLQPLYQAVAHGCRAGLHQKALEEVYDDRILRGTGSDGFYSTSKLGAVGADLGAVACFFDRPWTELSANLSASDQAWLIAVAAFNLRALGRLTEATEPMRVGMDRRVDQKDWKNAAISAGSLSELELTLGDVRAAVDDAAQSVTFADRSGDEFMRMANRTIHADALHQAGRRDEARRLFAEAETMQAEQQPEYPRLYSLPGVRYCDLLLSEAERAAWSALVARVERTASPSVPDWQSGLLSTCREVAERARTNLREHASLSLLSISLDHLTLARAALYEAVLTGSSIINHQSSIINRQFSWRSPQGELIAPPPLRPADPRLASSPDGRCRGRGRGPGRGLGDRGARPHAALPGRYPPDPSPAVWSAERGTRNAERSVSIPVGLAATRPVRSPPPHRKARLPPPHRRAARRGRSAGEGVRRGNGARHPANAAPGSAPN